MTLVVADLGGRATAVAQDAATPSALQGVELRRGETQTHVTIRGEGLFNYTAYDPDPQTLVIEIPFADATELPETIPLDTPGAGTMRVQTIGRDLVRFDLEGLSVDSREIELTDEGLTVVLNHASVVAAPTPVEELPIAKTYPIETPAEEPANEPEAAPTATAEPATGWRYAESEPVREVVDEQPTTGRETQPVSRLTEPRWQAATPTASVVEPVETVSRGSLSQARNLLSIDTLPGEPEPGVRVRLDGHPVYTHFVLETPPRVVVDLFGVTHRHLAASSAVAMGSLRGVRSAQHSTRPDRVTRVVLDLDRLLPYAVETTDDGLVVRLHSDSTIPSTLPVIAQASSPSTYLDTAAREPAPAPVEIAQPVAEPYRTVDVPTETRAFRYQETIEPEAADAERAPASEQPLPARMVPPSPAIVQAYEPEAADDGREPPMTTESVNAEYDWTTGSERQPEAQVAQLAEYPPADDDVPSGFVNSESSSTRIMQSDFDTKVVGGDRPEYVGERISLNLVDADLRYVFGLFHEISGLNFVLDPSVAGTVTIILEDVPWDQALELVLKNNGLGRVIEGVDDTGRLVSDEAQQVYRIATNQKLAQEAELRRQLKEAERREVEPITFTRKLSYSSAEDAQRIVQNGLLSDRGRVIIDERTNTLIVTDIPEKLPAIEALMEELDQALPQVSIESRIVLSTRDFTRELGVQWGASGSADTATGTQTNLDFPHTADVSYDLNLPINPGLSQLGITFGNVLDTVSLNLAIDALETVGKTRTISAPKITVGNNEQAEIESGTQLPVITTSAENNAAVVQVEYVSASLKLQVTPQITEEGTVLMELLVENNRPGQLFSFGGNNSGAPGIETQRAQTKVLVKDGGTMVIGGIFTFAEQESETGVPWFRKIPGLGWMFRSRSKLTDHDELLVFITPRILN